LIKWKEYSGRYEFSINPIQKF